MIINESKKNKFINNIIGNTSNETVKAIITKVVDKTWNKAIKSQWNNVLIAGLPSTDIDVIAKTRNNKYILCKTKLPKNSHGDIISDIPEWNVSKAVADSIIEWMYIPKI